MNDVFLNIFNLSITASIVVIAVLLLRLGMKKAPKWISVALWAFVGVRLIFPFAVESRFSLIPSIDTFSVESSSSAETFKVQTGVNMINSAANEHIASTGSSGVIIDAIDVLSVLWIVGAVALLLYGAVSYILLYRRLRTAVPLRDNVYQSENVKSPFVLGFMRPRIIVPFNLDDETLNNVLMHERAHIKRGDHIVKPLSYILLCFHWFNPFIWLSYILLCRDIEVACDEKVIKDLSFSERKSYALALLQCKVKNSTVAVCPVAFGEVSVKARIKNALSYKKPAMWVVALAVAVCVIASGCLLTNPKAESYSVETIIKEDTTVPVETAAAAGDSDIIESTTAFATEVETKASEAQNKVQTEAPETETHKTETPTVTEYYEEQPVYTKAETAAPVETTYQEPSETYAENQEYYYYEYDDTTKQEYEELTIPPVVPSWVENGEAVEVWNYEPPLSTVEKQNQALLAGSTGY